MDEREKQELLVLFQGWQNENLEAWNLVIGFSDLLLMEELGPLSEKQSEILRFIIRKARAIVDRWHNRNASIALKFDEASECREIDFVEIVNNVKSGLKNSFGINDVQAQIPESLPSIKSVWFLDRAISNLILCPFPSIPKRFPAATVDVHYVEHTPKVKVIIRVSIPEGIEIYWRDYPESRLDLARRIIELHGSELKIQEESDMVAFHFELPVWRQ